MSTENFLAIEYEISPVQAIALEGLVMVIKDCVLIGMSSALASSLILIIVQGLADGDRLKERRLRSASMWLLERYMKAKETKLQA